MPAAGGEQQRQCLGVGVSGPPPGGAQRRAVNHPWVHHVPQVRGRRRRHAHPVQPLGGAERQPRGELERLHPAELFHLRLLQPAFAACREVAADHPGRGELERRDQVIDVAELPARCAAADHEQPRRLEMPGQQRVHRVTHQGGRPHHRDRGARVNPARAARELLDLQQVPRHAAIRVREQRRILRQRYRVVRPGPVHHRTRHKDDPADALGGSGGQHCLRAAHVERAALPCVGGGRGVHVRVHHHVNPGQPRGKRRVTDVGDPPGYPGGVAAVVVDRHHAVDKRRLSQADGEGVTDAAGRPGDRHDRQRRRGATLTANAPLVANLPSRVSQNRLLPNSVASMTLLSCPTT